MTSANSAHSTAAEAAAVDALPRTRATPEVALHSRISLGRYVFLLLQLALLLVALRQFQIENAALLRISLLAFAGFAVHYFLPFKLRLPFFAGEVDFNSELQPGDRFQLSVDKAVRDGKVVAYGPILAATLPIWVVAAGR